MVRGSVADFDPDNADGVGEVLEERPECTHCDKVRRPQNRIKISGGQAQTVFKEGSREC